MTKVLDTLGREHVTQGIPRGIIVIFRGPNLPTGWALCTGAAGTPDLRDQFIIGDSAVSLGTAGGTVSATTALTHSGVTANAHSDHAVTQASNHSNHVVTQASGHSNHVVTQADDHGAHNNDSAHTHDAHTTSNNTASTQPVLNVAFTHAATAGHTHNAHSSHTGADLDAHSAHSGEALDAHSAHSGAALDAHSAHAVTQPSDHAIIKHFILAFIMKL